MWGIWKFRNTILFKNWNRFDPLIHNKIILSIKYYKIEVEEDKLDLLLNPIYFDDNPIGFFNGGVAENKCGIGIYLKIYFCHTVKAHFTGGTRNNMKDKLMGLWGFLLLDTRLSIKNLMVACDSKVTIDWINNKSNLDLIYLSHWKDKIRRLKTGFESINFMHIHR
jgi:hypothetical protein